MKAISIRMGRWWAGLLVVMGIFQMQCSFMPRSLRAFYKLPLPEVARHQYEADGVKVAYVQTGNPQGMPVVFIHGTPGSWEDWKLVMMRRELQSHFNLVTVDRPGWGSEARVSLNAPKISQQANLLGPVLDAAGQGRKVILVGHSFGGPIIVRMALDYPDKIAALILLAPILDIERDAIKWYNHVAEWALVKWILPDILDRANDEMLALPQELPALARQMGSLRMPVLLVHGLKDRLVDPENATFARRNFADTDYMETLLDDFGHLIPQLRPGEVVLAILSVAELVGRL